MKNVLNYFVCFMAMKLNYYVPKRVYVSKSALAYPRTQQMINCIKKLNRKVMMWKWIEKFQNTLLSQKINYLGLATGPHF